MALVGAGQLTFALVMFVRPSAVLAWWPWALTPLTARTLLVALLVALQVAMLRRVATAGADAAR